LWSTLNPPERVSQSASQVSAYLLKKLCWDTYQSCINNAACHLLLFWCPCHEMPDSYRQQNAYVTASLKPSRLSSISQQVASHFSSTICLSALPTFECFYQNPFCAHFIVSPAPSVCRYKQRIGSGVSVAQTTRRCDLIIYFLCSFAYFILRLSPRFFCNPI
jgi:hypothetical protein